MIIISLSVLMMNRCSSSKQDANSIHNQEALRVEYGVPDTSNEIILKKDISLYEYQGGLYKFIPEVDSLIIVENIYHKGNITTAVWYIPLCEDSIKVLDHLSWNNKKIQF